MQNKSSAKLKVGRRLLDWWMCVALVWKLVVIKGAFLLFLLIQCYAKLWATSYFLF